VKLFGSPSRRHDRTSPAAADVSTVDTLPADAARQGKASAELSGAELQVANPPEPKWDSNRLARRTDRYSHGGIRFRAALTGAGEVMRMS
jgi:hypothetical protein